MVTAAAIGISLWLTASAGYEALLADAEPVSNVGRFLEDYVGNCNPKDAPKDFDKAACLQRVKAAQKSYRGKKLVIELTDVREQLKFGSWDARKKAYRLLLTPMFSERSFGLSIGRPKRLNKAGLPVVRIVPVWVERPDGEPDFIFKNTLKRGMVRLELVVIPRKTWMFRRKNEDPLAGVEVKLLGLRLYEARGSKLLAEQTY